MDPKPDRDWVPVLTGHDVGVIICRIIAIWIGFSFIHYALQVFPILLSALQSSDPYLDEGLDVEDWLPVWLGFFLFLLFAFILWWKADAISSRMLGRSDDAEVCMDISAETLLRIAVVFAGIWHAVPHIAGFCINLTYFVTALIASDEESEVAFGAPPLTPGDYFTDMFRSAVYLVVCAFIILGSRRITSWLLAVRDIGLATSRTNDSES